VALFFLHPSFFALDGQFAPVFGPCCFWAVLLAFQVDNLVTRFETLSPSSFFAVPTPLFGRGSPFGLVHPSVPPAVDVPPACSRPF